MTRSYGSVLGATFSAMFPDKVGRIDIDGVCDAEDHYAVMWSNNLIDTDKTLQTFFDQCVAVGPARCPFYAPTADNIARNLTALYDEVRIRPVPVRTPTSYGLINYSRLKFTIFVALYNPFATFLWLASGLADLAARDGPRLFQLLKTPPFQCSCVDSPLSTPSETRKSLLPATTVTWFPRHWKNSRSISMKLFEVQAGLKFGRISGRVACKSHVE